MLNICYNLMEYFPFFKISFHAIVMSFFKHIKSVSFLGKAYVADRVYWSWKYGCTDGTESYQVGACVEGV